MMHPMDIRQATTPQELDDTRGLIRAFVAWHRARHPKDVALIDRYFDPVAFEAELASLPGKYAPPKGSLRIAYEGDKALGCVALRDLGDGICEMKRMFVSDGARGLGAGRALARAIIKDGRRAGYRAMRLDTSIGQVEAIGLYESCGFRRVEPCYRIPDEMRRWLVFFELDLSNDA